MTLGSHSPRWRAWYGALGALALALIAAVVIATVAVGSHASLTLSPAALAHVGLPFGGGKVTNVTAFIQPDDRSLPVSVRGDEVWPGRLVATGRTVTVQVTIRRPGWLSWLTGRTERVQLTLKTPSAALRSQFLTVKSGAPLRVAFRQPVRVVELGASSAREHARVLASPSSVVSIDESATAGTVFVAAAPRTWEVPKPKLVSWFPAGAGATAVAVPAPGTTIKPNTKITLTFSKPVAQVLGSSRPPVSPTTAGTWQAVNSHTITFEPQGYGYGLGANVSIGLPSSVRLVGGQNIKSDPVGRWSVPAGSTLRLQQMLAMLGYLPVSFRYKGSAVSSTLSAEVDAAIHPPSGTFPWRYPNTPSALKSMWAPGSSGELTRGAIMAFENQLGMTPDGVAGPAVWKALIAATLKGQRYGFGYTFVAVSEGSPESVNVWHNGHTVVAGPANTGIPAAPTATGTFSVYEHIPVGTMSGTNPDGTPYHDPGIPWISYFNGGDALHGFIRASYGFPQSLGCVEMPFAEAGRVWPYTPIGTIVNVT